jgi:hypothetical protein
LTRAAASCWPAYPLDARSGAIVRTIAGGPLPLAAAVDERTDQAVVAARGGATLVPDTWSWVPSWLHARLPFLPHPGPRTRVMPGSLTIFDAARP